MRASWPPLDRERRQIYHASSAAATIDWSAEDVGDAAARVGGVDVLLDVVTFDAKALDGLAPRALLPGGRALTTVAPTAGQR